MINLSKYKILAGRQTIEWTLKEDRCNTKNTNQLSEKTRQRESKNGELPFIFSAEGKYLEKISVKFEKRPKKTKNITNIYTQVRFFQRFAPRFLHGDELI